MHFCTNFDVLGAIIEWGAKPRVTSTGRWGLSPIHKVMGLNCVAEFQVQL